jgi:enamine deaminase RidA (YjgF/YER057c/UK114 family)
MEEQIKKAIKEAERFIKRAKEARSRISKDPSFRISGCKEIAAMKRASMDLSRVLVKIRNPGRSWKSVRFAKANR